jgi:hypothetical protein
MQHKVRILKLGFSSLQMKMETWLQPLARELSSGKLMRSFIPTRRSTRVAQDL